MRQMTLDDIHQSLLGIAKEMHKICVKHNIPYYMLGGTMLGAIRHKGFIPWDDDMDFGVPREFYGKLRTLLEQEMDSKYRVVCEDWVTPIVYYKIEDTETRIFPISFNSKEKVTGLNIDVFPLDNCTMDYRILHPIFRKQRFLNAIHNARFTNICGFSMFKHFILYVVRLIFPYSKEKWLVEFKELEKRIGKTGNDGMVNFSGIYKMKEVLDKRIFGIPKLYEFEDTVLYGPEDADGFLKHMYGDYMKLPPENKRHVHSQLAYMN